MNFLATIFPLLRHFIKGAIPLIEIGGWMICAYTCLLGKLLIDPNSGLNMFSLVAFPIQAWISVLNPLATLIIIHAYRKAFINLLQQNHCQTLHSSSAITPIYTIKKESNFAKTKTCASTNWYQAALKLDPLLQFLNLSMSIKKRINSGSNLTNIKHQHNT